MQKRSNLLDTLIKYTVAAIIIFVPLFPKFPLITIPGTFVAVRIEDVLLAFSGLLLAYALFPRIAKLPKISLNRIIFVFLFVGLISTLSAILITQTVFVHIGFLHWFRRIEYMIPLFLGIEAIKSDRRNLNFYIKLLLIVVIAAFIYGFGQKHLGWPIIITQNEEYSKGVALRYVTGSHVNSTFAGHYDLASFLVLVLPILVLAFFMLKGVWTRFSLLLGFFSGIWLLVNTASRISLVSYALAVSLSLIMIKKFKLVILVLIVSIGFVGFSSNLLDRYWRIIEVTKDKLQEINLNNDIFNKLTVFAAKEDPFPLRRELTPTPVPIEIFEDRSTNIRLNVEWPRAIRAFTKNPLLGTGYSSITLATDNDYLRLLGEVGILGFLSFISILILIIKTLINKFPYTNLQSMEKGFVIAVTSALPGIFLNALFIDVFEASKFATLFWLIVGFSLSLVKNE